MTSHRTLRAWQACIELSKAAYRASRAFPAEEKYGLTSQLRRAAVSSACNIAEGYARHGDKEKAHGVNMAIGSLAELDTLLVVAAGEGYLTTMAYRQLDASLQAASKLTCGLHATLRKRIAA